MKAFEIPVIKVVDLYVEDVITTSSTEETTMPKFVGPCIQTG